MIKIDAIKQLAYSLILIGTIATTAFADSGATDHESAQQINAANELLRKGEIDQAIKGYGSVADSKTHRDELKYNLAVAQYRKSDISAATGLFTETAGSANASIAARSRFNLGNCLYASALQTAEQDKPAAIEQLRNAISHFRGSLRGMPDNEDARANIELAAELIRKLEEEQKQEEQQKQDQQQQDQQQQDQQQKSEQDQKDQQQNQDQQQQNQDQKQQSKDSKSDNSQQENQQQNQSDKSKSDEAKADQSKSDKSKSEEQNKNDSQQNESQDKSDESQQPQPQDSGQQQPEQQSTSQQNQAEKPQQTQDRQSRSHDQQSPEEDESIEEQPQDNQSVPTGDLTAADQQDNQEPKGSVAMADPNAKDDGLMTKEEALKMLQAVRDRDMLRRLRQQQLERSRNVRVDRDW